MEHTSSCVILKFLAQLSGVLQLDLLQLVAFIELILQKEGVGSIAFFHSWRFVLFAREMIKTETQRNRGESSYT